MASRPQVRHFRGGDEPAQTIAVLVSLGRSSKTLGGALEFVQCGTPW